MSRHSFTVQETIRRPVHEVYDKLADHNSMGEWLGATITRIKNSPDKKVGPNGVGSVRRIQIFFFMEFEETIIVADKPRRLEYRISKGSPLKNHLGEIELVQMGDETEITWTVSFEAMFPMIGWVVTTLVTDSLYKGLKKLRSIMESDKK